MSRKRKARTITISISEGDGPLVQLRVASGSQEESWAVNLDNRANAIETALRAVESSLRFDIMLFQEEMADHEEMADGE